MPQASPITTGEALVTLRDGAPVDGEIAEALGLAAADGAFPRLSLLLRIAPVDLDGYEVVMDGNPPHPLLAHRVVGIMPVELPQDEFRHLPLRTDDAVSVEGVLDSLYDLGVRGFPIGH